MQLRALVVDDDRVARRELTKLLMHRPPGVSGNVFTVDGSSYAQLDQLNHSPVSYDVVFCDISWPEQSGLDLAAGLARSENSQVIITSTSSEHALDAFDMGAVDYLLKPFSAHRLHRAVERALLLMSDRTCRTCEQKGGPSRNARLPVQVDGRTQFVDTATIAYVTAERGHSILAFDDARIPVSYTLSDVERRLGTGFMRVHRSCLVNLDFIRELITTDSGGLAAVLGDQAGSVVEVSRRQATALRRRLGM